MENVRDTGFERLSHSFGILRQTSDFWGFYLNKTILIVVFLFNSVYRPSRPRVHRSWRKVHAKCSHAQIPKLNNLHSKHVLVAYIQYPGNCSLLTESELNNICMFTFNISTIYIPDLVSDDAWFMHEVPTSVPVLSGSDSRASSHATEACRCCPQGACVRSGGVGLQQANRAISFKDARLSWSRHSVDVIHQCVDSAGIVLMPRTETYFFHVSRGWQPRSRWRDIVTKRVPNVADNTVNN
jgi:hypothetical protein